MDTAIEQKYRELCVLEKKLLDKERCGRDAAYIQPDTYNMLSEEKMQIMKTGQEAEEMLRKVQDDLEELEKNTPALIGLGLRNGEMMNMMIEAGYNPSSKYYD